MQKNISFLTLFLLSSCAVANNQAIHIPTDDSQRLISQNLSMTTKDFMSLYMSDNVNHRRLAEMYLVGVIDSSEGNSWCSFDIASPNAIQEQAYLGLKETLKNMPSTRASKSITSKLNKLLPCKEQK